MVLAAAVPALVMGLGVPATACQLAPVPSTGLDWSVNPTASVPHDTVKLVPWRLAAMLGRGGGAAPSLTSWMPLTAGW